MQTSASNGPRIRETNDSIRYRTMRLATAVSLAVALLFITFWSMLAPQTAVYATTQGEALCFATPDDGATLFASADATALQQAIEQATAGSAIKAAGTCTGVSSKPVPAGYTNGGSAITQTLYISHNITLRGGYTTTNWTLPNPNLHPTTLSAAENGRVIAIAHATQVTLENLTLIEGNAGLQGGHTAADAGAAIYNQSAHLTLQATQIYSHTGLGSNNPRGAIYSLAPLTIHNSAIHHNTFFHNGGGIYATTHLTLTDSTVSHNSATNGGGIMLPFSNAQAYIENSTISYNSAQSGGGLTSLGPLSIYSSTIAYNTATTGGGLTAANSIYAYNLILYGNQASNNGGGAFLYIPSQLTAVSGGIPYHFILSTIQNNQANSSGGGLYNINTNSILWLEHSSVLSNTAVTSGGGVHNRSPLQVTHSTIAYNRVTSANGGQGGGIYAYNNPALIDSSTFHHNQTAVGNSNTQSGGSALYFFGGESRATVQNSTISQNSDHGTALRAAVTAVNPGALTITHTTIVSNSGGGLALAAGASITVANSIIADSTEQADCVAADLFTAVGHNISSDASCTGFTLPNTNPLLTPLADHGGPNHTMALLPGSPAADAAADAAAAAYCLPTDQRGAPRPQGAACDLGAVEHSAPIAVDDRARTLPDTAVSIPVLTNDIPGAGNPLTISSIGSPASGSATINGSAIHFTPATGFQGIVTFPYTITDGISSASATITVTVAFFEIHLPFVVAP